MVGQGPCSITGENGHLHQNLHPSVTRLYNSLRQGLRYANMILVGVDKYNNLDSERKSPKRSFGFFCIQQNDY